MSFSVFHVVTTDRGTQIQQFLFREVSYLIGLKHEDKCLPSLQELSRREILSISKYFTGHQTQYKLLGLKVPSYISDVKKH